MSIKRGLSSNLAEDRIHRGGQVCWGTKALFAMVCLISGYSAENNDTFTTFHLIKINKDTFEAVRMISDALGIAPKAIEYAGLKDKRAISVQQASIRGNYVEKLKKLKLHNIFIRNISPSKHSVKLGSNWGNHFEITIRNIDNKGIEKKEIEKLLEIVRTRGFPNYFGLQRFGTFRPNSHLIGRFILENDFKRAFDEFVIKTYPSEDQIKCVRLLI